LLLVDVVIRTYTGHMLKFVYTTKTLQSGYSNTKTAKLKQALILSKIHTGTFY
jgi:hypothetical protein